MLEPIVITCDLPGAEGDKCHINPQGVGSCGDHPLGTAGITCLWGMWEGHPFKMPRLCERCHSPCDSSYVAKEGEQHCYLCPTCFMRG